MSYQTSQEAARPIFAAFVTHKGYYTSNQQIFLKDRYI